MVWGRFWTIWGPRRAPRRLPAESRGGAPAPPRLCRAQNSTFFMVFGFFYEAQETLLRSPREGSEKPKRRIFGPIVVIFVKSRLTRNLRYAVAAANSSTGACAQCPSDSWSSEDTPDLWVKKSKASFQSLEFSQLSSTNIRELCCAICSRPDLAMHLRKFLASHLFAGALEFVGEIFGHFLKKC